MKNSLFSSISSCIQLFIFLWLGWQLGSVFSLRDEALSALSADCDDIEPLMRASVEYVSSTRLDYNLKSCLTSTSLNQADQFVRDCELELRRCIDQITGMPNSIKEPLLSILSPSINCMCFDRILDEHVILHPLVSALGNYCKAKDEISDRSLFLSHSHASPSSPVFQTDAVSLECKNKMNSLCRKHLNSYQESVQCFFKNVNQVQYVCDDNLMSGFLAGIFPICNKDLLNDVCIITLKEPYDSYDVMNCLHHNYATISPSCRVAIDGLNGDNIPCAADSTKYCKDKTDIVDFFSCISDIDEALISQTCLATVDGYNRCKYPDNDDDEALSYGGTYAGDDDDDDDVDDDDSTTKKIRRGRLLQESGKKSSICWAKIYLADDDDDDDDDESWPSFTPTIFPTLPSKSVIVPDNDDYHPDANDDADDDDSTTHKHGKSNAANTESSVSSGLVLGVSIVSIALSVAIIYVIRSYWKGNQRGRGRYVRASTRDLDDDEEASEEIIQSRVMDIGDKGKKTQSIAMRKLESSYNEVHGFDNPFADEQSKVTSGKASVLSSFYYDLPAADGGKSQPRDEYLPI